MSSSRGERKGRRHSLSAMPQRPASSPATKDSGGESVRVYCRFRPQSSKEVGVGARNVVRFSSKEPRAVAVADAGDAEVEPKEFHFDHVFAADAEQEAVYETSARPVVESVLQGYNGTVFAYGQTGAGKTHTMEGVLEDEHLRGIIPRMVSTVFKGVEKADVNIEFTLKVSMLEIYNERIRDLLNPSRQNLRVREDEENGVWVGDASEFYVTKQGEILDALHLGAANRQTASTQMNQHSSRSHSIFVLTVAQRNVQTLTVKRGRLYLVDLAGSEKVRKTGAEGARLDEAKNINKSLSALGNVIKALTDPKCTHVPYRDSKLTRVLQDSLGGNSRTALIINCSPSAYNYEETLSTLRFGQRAKQIKNVARVNQERSPHELKAMLEAAEREVARLRTQNEELSEELRMLRAAAKGRTSKTLGTTLADDGGSSRWTSRSSSPSSTPAESTADDRSLPSQSATGEQQTGRDMALLMERLEEERATCNDLRTQLEVTARQQTDVLMDIQRDVQRMRDSIRKKDDRVSELSREVESLEELRKEHEDSLEQARMALENREAEVNVLRGLLRDEDERKQQEGGGEEEEDDDDDERSTSPLTTAALREALRAARERAQCSLNEVDTVWGMVHSLRAEREEEEGKVRTLYRKLTEAREAAAASDQRAERSKAKAKQFESDLENARAREREAISAARDAAEQVSSLHRSLSSSHEGMREAMTRASGAARDASIARSEAESKVHAAERAQRAAEERAQHAEKGSEEAEEERTAAVSRAAAAEARVEEAQQGLERAQGECAAAVERADSARAQAEAAQSAQAEAEAEAHHAQERASRVEQQADAAAAAQAEAVSARDAAQQEAEAAQLRAKRLEEELQEAREAAQALRVSVEQKTEEGEAQRAPMELLEREKRAAEARAQEAQERAEAAEAASHAASQHASDAEARATRADEARAAAQDREQEARKAAEEAEYGKQAAVRARLEAETELRQARASLEAAEKRAEGLSAKASALTQRVEEANEEAAEGRRRAAEAVRREDASRAQHADALEETARRRDADVAAATARAAEAEAAQAATRRELERAEAAHRAEVDELREQLRGVREECAGEVRRARERAVKAEEEAEAEVAEVRQETAAHFEERAAALARDSEDYSQQEVRRAVAAALEKAAREHAEALEHAKSVAAARARESARLEAMQELARREQVRQEEQEKERQARAEAERREHSSVLTRFWQNLRGAPKGAASGAAVGEEAAPHHFPRPDSFGGGAGGSGLSAVGSGAGSSEGGSLRRQPSEMPLSPLRRANGSSGLLGWTPPETPGKFTVAYDSEAGHASDEGGDEGGAGQGAVRKARNDGDEGEEDAAVVHDESRVLDDLNAYRTGASNNEGEGEGEGAPSPPSAAKIMPNVPVPEDPEELRTQFVAVLESHINMNLQVEQLVNTNTEQEKRSYELKRELERRIEENASLEQQVDRLKRNAGRHKSDLIADVKVAREQLLRSEQRRSHAERNASVQEQQQRLAKQQVQEQEDSIRQLEKQVDASRLANAALNDQVLDLKRRLEEGGVHPSPFAMHAIRGGGRGRAPTGTPASRSTSRSARHASSPAAAALGAFSTPDSGRSPVLRGRGRVHGRPPQAQNPASASAGSARRCLKHGSESAADADASTPTTSARASSPASAGDIASDIHRMAQLQASPAPGAATAERGREEEEEEEEEGDELDASLESLTDHIAAGSGGDQGGAFEPVASDGDGDGDDPKQESEHSSA